LTIQSGQVSGSGCGCGCGASDLASICPCGGNDGCPWPVTNLPGLPSISYRAGDFGSFRQAMLLPSQLDPAGEIDLQGWRPTAGTDLALQIVDWWAYVAEVLTFYTERIANESYLGTALLAESVGRLVSLLGYRPRPGIGATATLGVIAAGAGSVTLPSGFQVSSKSAPGVPAQIFELGQAVTITTPTSVPAPPVESTKPQPAGGPPANTPPGTADPPAHSELVVRGGVLIQGKPTSISVGDRLLLIPAAWSSANPAAAMVAVGGLVQETDPHGKVNTRVLLTGAQDLGAGALAANYRLCRPTVTNHLITVPAWATVIWSASAGISAGLVLDSTARSIKAGDPVVIEVPGAGTGVLTGSGFDIVQVGGYSEVLWYANAVTPPPTASPGTTGIPLLVAQLAVDVFSDTDLGNTYSGQVGSVTVRSGWTDVGTLLDTPLNQVSGVPATVTLSQPPAAAVGTATPALIEDANGAGGPVAATPVKGTNQVALAPAASTGPSSASGSGSSPASGSLPATLQPPLRLLWDLISVSRGATVTNESLGTGDATQAGQDFSLNQSPVTYLADTSAGAAPPGAGGPAGAGSRSGTGYSSTVQVAVDGLLWSEVPMFYGRGPTDTIFVTREDEQGTTHVLTGDGVNGARLRTGATVTATYRVGSGAASPPAGTLTQILSPQTNLSALRNPAAAGGGADPDAAALLATLAPASVLTFGRAISADDYEIVAAQAAGVTRAGAVWAWDPTEQRAMTIVYVGDGDSAVTSARAALKAAADPNRPVRVRLAIPCLARLRMTLLIDQDYVTGDVVSAVESALLGSPGGLFAPGVLAIGETLYRSRIESVCAVPGVLAVHRLRMRWRGKRPGTVPRDARGPRYNPGEGGYFDLAATRLTLNAEVDTDD
jgi:hypothetical protein